MSIRNIKLINFKTLLFGSVLFFIPFLSNAQCGDLDHVKQSWELGLNGGLANYKGDVSTNIKLLNTRYSIGGLVKYNIDYYSGLRLNYNYISIFGNDSYTNKPFHTYRNERFNASLNEISLLYDYNFIPFLHPKQLMNWSPYLVGGVSAMYISAYNNNDFNSDLSTMVLALPFGGGSRIQLNPKWIISFEFIARKLYTDKLDFPDEVYANNTQKTITTNNDWVYTLQVGMSYTFIRVICPEPVKDL